MPSRKDKKKATLKPAASAAPTVSLPIELTGYLDDLAARRVGGEINLRGIRFQLLYACERMLTLLRPDSPATIRLEGLEDVDLHNALIVGQTEYVQLKTSVNELTLGNFWGLNVLQNFLAVYRGAPKATFTLAHNMSLASGLQQLARHDPAALAHWGAKLRTLDNPLTTGQAEDFLRRVRFEHITENQLHERCIQAMLEHFEVHARSEEQFLKAVFYHAFDWSRQRATVTYRQLAEVVQRVQDGYSTAPLNEAIRHNWLERVSYAAEVQRPAGAYFAGQAARPYHIAQQLPVRRVAWEVRIEAALAAHTAVAVKSSSGQGKSTLAWQVGYAWQQRGGQVYELRNCASSEAANAIVEYLRAWVRIGEQPLIVIDGLSAQTSRWAEVVERTTDLPVKFLLTTREEDWYRFGSGIITLPVHLVEVALDQDEAERIYQELRQRGHLSVEVIPWQPAWEAVAERQLLIEYVYLLTQGGLLRDRLAGQLRALSQESRDAPAKLEILRLVAVADCLSLQLDTGRLVEYIAQKIGFDSDRGEVLKQLEREYFLRFGTRQVEGLHPVRSRHLAELLHELLPLEDTLTKVFGLLVPAQTQEFFAGLPGLLAAPERRELYTELAPLLAERTLLEITAALDGLLRGEALRYWEQNQVVLDDVFAVGGLELFIFETIPFAKPNLLSNLGDIGGLGDSLHPLLARSSQLAPLVWADSELYLFAKLLHPYLILDRRSATYLGISQLGDWLNRLGLPLPVLSNCNEEALLSALRTQPLAETRELFAYLWLTDPTAAQDFTTRHKELLFSHLQEQTDTPTLREEGKEVLIEYLLELEQANESSKLSVARLETIATFLPGYDYYHSKAVVFSCLPVYMLRVTLMNTEKRMTAETLLMPRVARINRLWADTILNIYRAKSVYEWQANLLAMRRTSVELVRQIVRLLESGMEKQTNRIKVASEAVVAQSELLEAQRQRRPKLPPTRTVELTDAEKAVAEWQASLRNFVGQLGDLITPKNSNSRNLATCNLTSAVEHLPAMQDAHRMVSARHTYFELSSLEQEETKWYPRLLSSVRYFVHCQEKLSGAIQYAVRERISRWVDADNYTRLATLHAILRRCEQEMHVFFWLPNSFRRDGLLLTAVVGIQGIDLQDEQQMTELTYWLRDLGEISADFVLLVPVRNNQAAGQGIRYQKAFFQWFKSVVDGKATEKPSDWLLPLPIAPTLADIQTLGGVESCLNENPAEHAQIVHLLQSLWKLLEYRQRLSSAASSQNWLSRLEMTTRTAIATELHQLHSKLSKENFNLLTNCVTQCLANDASVDEPYLVTVLTSLINSNLKVAN